MMPKNFAGDDTPRIVAPNVDKSRLYEVEEILSANPAAKSHIPVAYLEELQKIDQNNAVLDELFGPAPF